jgi:hypothetical protein
MMKKTDLTPMQVWGILGGGAIMLSLAMGMRQSFGLLQPHMIRDIGITAADFSLAVALAKHCLGRHATHCGYLGR